MLLNPNSLPSIFLQQSITLLISCGLVPIIAIHFKSDMNRRNRKIDAVSTDLKFLKKLNLHLRQAFPNPSLNTCFAFITPEARERTKLSMIRRDSSKVFATISASNYKRRPITYLRTKSEPRASSAPIESLAAPFAVMPQGREGAAFNPAVNIRLRGRLPNPEHAAAFNTSFFDIVAYMLSIPTQSRTEPLFSPTQIRPEHRSAPFTFLKDILISTAGTLLNSSGGLFSYPKYTTYG